MLMGTKKKYENPDFYERKLAKVMGRFGVDEADYDYNFDRHGCWVQFRLNGELYRFDHSIEKAKSRDVKLTYGSDAFAQVVMALEKLVWMIELGIYDLQTWVAGMRFLPPPVEVPTFFRFLGFAEIPASMADVKDRYRTLAKQMHPDAGGDEADFKALKDSAERAMAYFGDGGGE